MKKGIATAFLCLVGSWALTSIGLSQNDKVGFVNTLEVLYATEEGKSEIEKLNQFAAEKQQEITSEGSVLQKLQEQYTAQQMSLNPETRAEMERDIQDRDLRLKRLQEDVQLEFNKRRDELLARMSEKIREIISEYGPQNGYGVIFLRNETQAYVDLSLDITQAIIKIYNERNLVANPGASP